MLGRQIRTKILQQQSSTMVRRTNDLAIPIIKLQRSFASSSSTNVATPTTTITRATATGSSTNSIDPSLSSSIQRENYNNTNTTNNTKSSSLKELLKYAQSVVREYDTAGYLPGQLLYKDQHMQQCYYAIRCFWIETGLRFGSTAKVPIHSTPQQHLDYWQAGINSIFTTTTTNTTTTTTTTTSNNNNNEQQLQQQQYQPEQQLGSYDFDHPTINLLRILYNTPSNDDVDDDRIKTIRCWTKQHFHDVLDGRRVDLDVKQYETVNDIIRHAEQSCGTVCQLVLESGNITVATNSIAHEAARHIGICHGITMNLRKSIPILSTTGKLIIPQELCTKYGIRSPRYLLSSLGMGDEQCHIAMEHAISDIVDVARYHLHQARLLRHDIIEQVQSNNNSIISSSSSSSSNDSNTKIQLIIATLLPGLASETFLNRLEKYQFQLTDRNLRHVSSMEHTACSLRMIYAYYKLTY